MNIELSHITRRGLLQSAILGGAAAAFAKTAVAQVQETVLWRAGEGGYHTYRIPALLTSKHGTLLAFCEGRKDNARDHGDIDLLVKRSADGGKTWSAHGVVYEEGGTEKVTIGNPCPVVDQESGTIFLPFCRDNKEVMITISKDDGRTWSKPQNITEAVSKPDWSWYATGPGVGIQIREGKHRGRLVIPCDHREKLEGADVKVSHVFYSDDRGKTWNPGANVSPHTDECQVAEISGGRLLINMRNYWERDGKMPEKGRMRTQSVSDDGGATWKDFRFLPELVEPVCEASLVGTTPKGRSARPVLLFSNPADREKRIRMTVRRSEDEGQTWSAGTVLHDGPTAYSCLTVLPDSGVGILYERGETSPYETLVFARFPMAAVR